MPDSVDEAGDYLVKGEYETAFHMLCQTANDSMQPVGLRADAFHLLGTLVQMAPEFAAGDESGLSHYQKAIQLVPDHLWAAVGIVSGFGYSPPQHQDKTAFLAADSIIQSQWEQLDDAARSQVERQRRIFESM